MPGRNVDSNNSTDLYRILEALYADVNQIVENQRWRIANPLVDFSITAVRISVDLGNEVAFPNQRSKLCVDGE